jgi:hypothetical protein
MSQLVYLLFARPTKTFKPKHLKRLLIFADVMVDIEELEELLMLDEESEEEINAEDEIKLAEIYRLSNRLLKLLEDLKSHELREATALTLIKEIVGNDRLLLGLASKMLQDITFGFDDDESYVS